MDCPKCGEKQHCPCDSCKDRLPEGRKPWIEHPDENTIECAYCGLTKHMDWWESEAWKQCKLSEGYRDSKKEFEQWEDHIKTLFKI